MESDTFIWIQNNKTTKSWYQYPDLGTKDDYQFFLDLRAFVQLNKFYGKDNEFWQQLKDHSSYDDFWQRVDFYNI
jgi:hypothetical protein